MEALRLGIKWAEAVCVKFRNRGPILPENHLIKKEVETINLHLATDRVISAKPDVGLFCDRGVEEPLAFAVLKLRVRGRVTMLLAEEVASTVLAVEMEDIDCQANVCKERVVFDSTLEMAVVVVKDVIWVEFAIIGAFDEFLRQRGSIPAAHAKRIGDRIPQHCARPLRRKTSRAR